MDGCPALGVQGYVAQLRGDAVDWAMYDFGREGLTAANHGAGRVITRRHKDNKLIQCVASHVYCRNGGACQGHFCPSITHSPSGTCLIRETAAFLSRSADDGGASSQNQLASVLAFLTQSSTIEVLPSSKERRGLPIHTIVEAAICATDEPTVCATTHHLIVAITVGRSVAATIAIPPSAAAALVWLAKADDLTESVAFRPRATIVLVLVPWQFSPYDFYRWHDSGCALPCAANLRTCPLMVSFDNSSPLCGFPYRKSQGCLVKKWRVASILARGVSRATEPLQKKSRRGNSMCNAYSQFSAPRV